MTTTPPEQPDSDRKPEHARWKGRHAAKDQLRDRVWAALTSQRVALGPVLSRIPNFVGADLAAQQLATLPEWARAHVVKVNPDPAQGWVRLEALSAGKRVYTPVPELTRGYPFVELDPAELMRRGIRFESVMFSEHFVEIGRPVDFDEIPHVDIAVAGCVAVTTAGGRLGKGGGFADLEFGVFHELGTVDTDTLVATTVHDLQVVEVEEIVMLAHDTPLDVVATPTRLLRTNTSYPIPSGIDWNEIQQDQLDDIPVLRRLMPTDSPTP